MKSSCSCPSRKLHPCHASHEIRGVPRDNVACPSRKLHPVRGTREARGRGMKTRAHKCRSGSVCDDGKSGERAERCASAERFWSLCAIRTPSIDSGHSRVAVMQPAQIRLGDNLALVRRLGGTRIGRVPVQRQGCSGLVVVCDPPHVVAGAGIVRQRRVPWAKTVCVESRLKELSAILPACLLPTVQLDCLDFCVDNEGPHAIVARITSKWRAYRQCAGRRRAGCR